jgi:quercetin dioxygenase-like cupin family protein
VLPGIWLKTLCYGDKTLMSEFRLTAGRILPLHSHAFEQTGYLVKGSLRLTIGEEQQLLHAGDSWCIPGDVEHGAVCMEDTVALEIFSPVREDYLP